MLPKKPYKILLIGDSCIDKYIYGEVKRINPEAPVPVLDYKKTEIRNGMCWNVYNNLVAFGLEVCLLTNTEKIIKTRYIDEKTNQQILRLDEESEVLPLQESEILNNDLYDCIVISDYNKGFLTEEKIFEIVCKATCPVFIDTKKTKLPKENCFIKINDFEYNKLNNETKLNNNLIITLGSGGAFHNGIHYPSEKVNVYDVVGAGDTFLAALTFAYLECGKIEKSISFANKAAAISVQNRGTYVLTNNDISSLSL